MAEGLARSLAAPGVEVASAGTHPNPKGVHPFAVDALRDRGLDISSHRAKHIDELAGEFDYVITLCDSAAQECPNVPARRRRLHWSIADPGNVPGGESELRAAFSATRDEIERRLRQWLAEENLLREPAAAQSLVEKVRAQLAQYEHPLFRFDARPAGESVEVQIHSEPPRDGIHVYSFQLRPREIEHKQFPWTFQKQLYDCLHDYVIEMFTRNPQREN